MHRRPVFQPEGGRDGAMPVREGRRSALLSSLRPLQRPHQHHVQAVQTGVLPRHRVSVPGEDPEACAGPMPA
jgi:hypothetical protein